MGLFLQKTNIIRDYLEDLHSDRQWYPAEVSTVGYISTITHILFSLSLSIHIYVCVCLMIDTAGVDQVC
jgi:hypothetical protein